MPDVRLPLFARTARRSGRAFPATAGDSDDTISLKIAGLRSYESITDGADGTIFVGSSITLTAAEVNSGLTLHSTYGGKLSPVNTLTLTASSSTAGESVSSAPQSIVVTDPPAGTAHGFALLTQYMASTGASGAGTLDAFVPPPGHTGTQPNLVAPH